MELKKKKKQYYGKILSIKEMLTKQPVLFIHFTLWNGRFPYLFIYLNLWNPYPFIYLKPEKVTLSGGAGKANIGSTPRGGGVGQASTSSKGT